jgi:hypothetical protein
MERLADKPEWAVYLAWYRHMDDIDNEQDRGRLVLQP